MANWLGRRVSLDDGSNSNTETLWGLWVHQDFHHPEHHAAHLVQGGLGIANYADAAAVGTYRARIAKSLALAGFDQAGTRAARVIDLERAIAATHASRADTDDIYKTDNNWSRADFVAKAPGLDWDAYFRAARLDAAPNFVVWQPGAVIGGAKLAGTWPLDGWRDYLAFHLIDHYAAALPQGFREGTSDPSVPNAVFSDLIAQRYVEQAFPPRSKAAVTDMVATIRVAFRVRLAGLDWMTPETRAKALAKLAALHIGLGYPERWLDDRPLIVTRGDALGNLRRAEALLYARDVARLGQPVDLGDWPPQVHPQNVGAILDVSPNTMEFSAALFQPPFFDPDGDMASNYGSAGAGLAHEVSHSFDELGNQYDAQGRLVRWWGAEDTAHFRAMAERLAAQLDACAAKPGMNAHGKQILSESVADLGGLAVAYDAYHLALHGRSDAIKDGLTGDQRFFIAFARRWRRVQTDDALRTQIDHDTHAPPRCRSNLVRNSDAWVRAFGVKPGDALYLAPQDRVRIW